MAHYSISGVFVKFLIDRFGLEPFKEAYGQNRIHELWTRHGFTVDGLVKELCSGIDSFVGRTIV